MNTKWTDTSCIRSECGLAESCALSDLGSCRCRRRSGLCSPSALTAVVPNRCARENLIPFAWLLRGVLWLLIRGRHPYRSVSSATQQAKAKRTALMFDRRIEREVISVVFAPQC
jgi:hypothetical protein